MAEKFCIQEVMMISWYDEEMDLKIYFSMKTENCRYDNSWKLMLLNWR